MATSPWFTATVVAVRDETPRAKTLRLHLPHRSDHLAGQHVVVRLTAPDGYVAQRSYSVASAPDGSDELELTVELLPDGEVSSFLHDVVEVGDELELRGPLGGFFVWDGASPALLVGGGSGVVPLMAMLRLAHQRRVVDRVRMVVSARAPEDLLYAAELAGPETSIVYTRATPATFPRAAGRLMASDIPPLAELGDVTAYVCGSAGFCNTAGDLLVGLGQPVDRIRTERFGPTA
jgi:ferredoxin-NADP reductase